MHPPVTDLRVALSPAQSLSVQAQTAVGEDCHRYSCTALGLVIKSLPILLRSAQSTSVGALIRWLALSAGYFRSGRSAAR